MSPAHPAARAVYDEEGKNLSLGLSEAEIRLECLKQAQSSRAGWSHTEIIPIAEAFSAFVLGTDKDHPATDGEARKQAFDALVQTQTFKVCDFPDAAGMSERLQKAVGAYPGNATNQKAAEPARPPLSEVAQDALYTKLRRLRQDLFQAEADNQSAFVARDSALSDVIRLRREIAELSRDLGEANA